MRIIVVYILRWLRYGKCYEDYGMVYAAKVKVLYVYTTKIVVWYMLRRSWHGIYIQYAARIMAWSTLGRLWYGTNLYVHASRIGCICCKDYGIIYAARILVWFMLRGLRYMVTAARIMIRYMLGILLYGVCYQDYCVVYLRRELWHGICCQKFSMFMLWGLWHGICYSVRGLFSVIYYEDYGMVYAARVMALYSYQDSGILCTTMVLERYM